MKKLLPIFSYLLHPLFIPVYATAFYFFWTRDFFLPTEMYLMLVQVVILTVFIPIAVFYLLLSIGKIDSIMISNLNQRKYPLMVNALLLYILIQKSFTIERTPELYFFFLGGFASTLLALLFLLIGKKISIHMIGISSITVFIAGFSLKYQITFTATLAVLLILNGLVGSSRLQMKAHNLSELALGFLGGCIPQILLYYFWL
ncbi:MAG: hypothetical protein ACK4RM_00320 [Flavobacterium sp.]